MLETIITFKFNSLLGILLYWAPLLLCAVGYTTRTWQHYQNDVSKRREADDSSNAGPGNRTYYVPTDTIGTLIGRALASITPVANLWAAMFDVAPVMFRKLFTWIELIFDQPLVPQHAKEKSKNK